VEAREEAHLTQRELAARLRVPRTTVSRVELGERRLDVLEMLLWAKAMDIAPNTLFRRVLKRLQDVVPQ
jgi:transcriptional regulator with XRE-family HTH domain